MPGEAPSDLVLWKSVWDFVLNDPEFRLQFTGGGDYKISECGGSRNSIKHEKGTIYISDPNVTDGQGHFISYEMKNGKIHIFDSASPGGQYGEWATLPILRRIAKRAGKEFVLLPNHPQVHEEDSFCQTWSLAWLSPMRKYTLNVKTPSQGIERLYIICKMIINDYRFEEYVMKHRMNIRQYIINEKMKNPAFKTAKGFINYSRDMTPEMFRNIFED
jgi:hypothetical protein